MYSICKIGVLNIASLLKVARILHKCGKDMAAKYNLHHWDNSNLKNWIIIVLCVLRNNVYLVYDNKTPVATFQTRKIGKSFLFMKLATSPDYAGRGVGTFCLNEIERLGKNEGCQDIICEVYDKSENAIRFYLNRGYVEYGTVDTLKYRELKLKKEI